MIPNYPAMLEYGCEIVFPIGEGTSNGIVGKINFKILKFII